MSKKKPLSKELQEECAAAHQIFLEKKNALKLSQKKIADAAGISAPAVNHYFKGVNPLNVQFAAVLARLLEVSVSDFSPRLASEIEQISEAIRMEHDGKESNVIAADFSPKRAREGEIDIPHYDVRAAMGAGQVLPSDYIETIRHVTVSIEYLRTQGVSYTQPDNLGMITGFGESMNKTFTSGDPLIIDKGVTSVVTDGVYLFTLSGALFVKRLQIIPGGYRVISDNDAYPPYDITGADLKHLTIHARVLLAWRSQRL